MAWLTTLLIVVQVIAAIAVIVLVLLQHGKGADMGAAFGGGASGSLFGATGSANFLSRSTGVVATVFFLATLGLAYTGTEIKRPASDTGGVMGTVPAANPGSGAKRYPDAERSGAAERARRLRFLRAGTDADSGDNGRTDESTKPNERRAEVGSPSLLSRAARRPPEGRCITIATRHRATAQRSRTREAQ